MVPAETPLVMFNPRIVSGTSRHILPCSDFRNLLILSNRCPENSPEYSEFLYLYENHCSRVLRRSACAGRAVGGSRTGECPSALLLYSLSSWAGYFLSVQYLGFVY